jgi:hypothetical protein
MIKRKPERRLKKMALVDDILGTIILIGVCVGVSVVMIIHTADSIQEKEQIWGQLMLEESYSSMIDSILEITEPGSGRTYGELVGSAVFYKTDFIDTVKGRINIEEDLSKLISIMHKNDGFYFSATPKYEKIELFFIIDGSETLYDEESMLMERLITLASDINDSLIAVPVNITILFIDYENSSRCDNFTGFRCHYLDNIYYNESHSLLDIHKKRLNLTEPEHVNIVDEAWKSDWETALSYSIIKFDNKNLSNLKVFFPITDGLPTSTQYIYNCPKEYADSILSRDKHILNHYNVIVNPVFSTNIDSVRFCDDYVIQHMQRLIDGTSGTLLISKGNFNTRIIKTLEDNIRKISVTAGADKKGKAFSIQRNLPMPDGRFCDMRFKVFIK